MMHKRLYIYTHTYIIRKYCFWLLFTVLRRVFGRRVQRAHCTIELRSAPAHSRVHRESDPATLSQIQYNKYVYIL